MTEDERRHDNATTASAGTQQQDDDDLRCGDSLMKVDDDRPSSSDNMAATATSSTADGILNSGTDAALVLQKEDRWQTLAGVAGNVLEWYDFAVFGYFGDILGEVFFPPHQKGNASTSESFLVFGVAFLMRPIGGMMMGYIGDLYGRKKALVISIFLMAFPTFLMGCLPGYSHIGDWAIVLLVFVRLLQGLSVGGQLVSSLVFTLENHDPVHWGLYGSFVMAAANFGSLLGSTTSSLLRASLSHEQLVSWGWRIPFLAGVLVSACGFYLKGHGSDHTGQGYQQTSVSGREENADDDELLLHPTTLKNPLIEAFSRHNLRPLLAACMAPMLWASGFYLWFVWMAIYMAKLISNPVPGAFPLNAAALFFSVCLLFPIAGALSDKFGRLRIMSLGAVGMGILSPLLIRLIAIGNPVFAFLSQCTMGVFLSLYGAPMCAWLVEAFEPQARLTSVAIGYNVAQAIAGGSTPFLATYFVDNIGVRSPGWILTFLALTGLTGLHCVAPALLGPSNFGAVPFVNVDSSRGD